MDLILDKLYPIGSLYFTIDNVNPSAKLGGTWESLGDSDTYLRLGGSGTGGSNTYSLTSANIPSHTHSVGAHAHGLNSHTHSIPALSGTAAETIVKVAYASGSGSNGGAILSNAALVYSNSANTFTPTNAHTHSVTTVANTTGGASGNTANSTAFNSGSYGAATVTAIDITPKYQQIYAWKRTA